jgi:uncharacterized protein YjbJ (UPF0337 family)
MNLEKRMEATSKTLNGKLQQSIGKLTGNQEQSLEGRMQQLEATLIDKTENIKDETKQIISKA